MGTTTLSVTSSSSADFQHGLVVRCRSIANDQTSSKPLNRSTALVGTLFVQNKEDKACKTLFLLHCTWQLICKYQIWSNNLHSAAGKHPGCISHVVSRWAKTNARNRAVPNQRKLSTGLNGFGSCNRASTTLPSHPWTIWINMDFPPLLSAVNIVRNSPGKGPDLWRASDGFWIWRPNNQCFFAMRHNIKYLITEEIAGDVMQNPNILFHCRHVYNNIGRNIMHVINCIWSCWCFDAWQTRFSSMYWRVSAPHILVKRRKWRYLMVSTARR